MVLRATVRSLKPKKPKNLKTFLKNLRFLPALPETKSKQTNHQTDAKLANACRKITPQQVFVILCMGKHI